MSFHCGNQRLLSFAPILNEVSNRVTMFTFNRGVWKIRQRELIERYGYVDTNGRPSLYCTVDSKPNNQGLYLKVEDDAVRLYHVDNTRVAEWLGDVVIVGSGAKCPFWSLFTRTRINSGRNFGLTKPIS